MKFIQFFQFSYQRAPIKSNTVHTREFRKPEATASRLGRSEMRNLYRPRKGRFLPGGQTLRKSPLREIFSLSEAQRCFCFAISKGKNREPGSRDFSVRKNTCDDTYPHPRLNKVLGLLYLRQICGIGHSQKLPVA